MDRELINKDLLNVDEDKKIYFEKNGKKIFCMDKKSAISYINLNNLQVEKIKKEKLTSADTSRIKEKKLDFISELKSLINKINYISGINMFAIIELKEKNSIILCFGDNHAWGERNDFEVESKTNSEGDISKIYKFKNLCFEEEDKKIINTASNESFFFDEDLYEFNLNTMINTKINFNKYNLNLDSNINIFITYLILFILYNFENIYISPEMNVVEQMSNNDYIFSKNTKITQIIDNQSSFLKNHEIIKELIEGYGHQTTPLVLSTLLYRFHINSLNKHFPIYKNLKNLKLDLRDDYNNFYLYFKIIFNLIKLVGTYNNDDQGRKLLFNYRMIEPKNHIANIELINDIINKKFYKIYNLTIKDKMITKILNSFFIIFLGKFDLFPFLKNIDNFNRYKKLNLNFLEIFYDNIVTKIGEFKINSEEDFLKDAYLIYFFLQNEKLDNGFYIEETENPDFIYEITNNGNLTYIITKSYRKRSDNTPWKTYNKYQLTFEPKEIFNGKIGNIKEYCKNLFWFYEKIDQPHIFRFVQYLYNQDIKMLLDENDLTIENFIRDRFDNKIYLLYSFFTTKLDEEDLNFKDIYIKFYQLSDSIKQNILYWFFDIILGYDLADDNFHNQIFYMFIDFNTLITFLLESGHYNDNKESNNKIFISWAGETVRARAKNIIKKNHIFDKDTSGHTSALLLFFRKYYMKSSVSELNIDHDYITDGFKNKYEKDYINIEKYKANTKPDCVRLK